MMELDKQIEFATLRVKYYRDILDEESANCLHEWVASRAILVSLERLQSIDDRNTQGIRDQKIQFDIHK